MSVNSCDDKILLHRLLQGDEQAFIETYGRYWYKLFLSSYRRTRNKAVAEEIVQNLFLKLWEKRGTLAIGRLENYLFSSIRNATIDFLNKQMVADKYLEHQKVYLYLEGNTTEEMVELDNLEEEIEKGLQALSGKSEKVFRLRRMDHWPVEKIALHLNLSEKTVHYHLTRSTKFIRSYLQEFTLSIILLLL
ncbi:MAG: sigma-70 family RNA polymerase sigma factor [Cyclobacteriaceae bacterium]